MISASANNAVKANNDGWNRPLTRHLTSVCAGTSGLVDDTVDAGVPLL